MKKLMIIGSVVMAISIISSSAQYTTNDSVYSEFTNDWAQCHIMFSDMNKNRNIQETANMYKNILEKYTNMSDKETSLSLSRLGWCEMHLKNMEIAESNNLQAIAFLTSSNLTLATKRELVINYAKFLRTVGRSDESKTQFEKLHSDFGMSVTERFIVEYGNVIQKGTLDEIFRIIFSEDKLKSMEFAKPIAERLSAECSKSVKAVLRSQGKTFVGEEGQTNIAALIQPVIDAANAPALMGMEEALSACGITVTQIDRTHVKQYGKDISNKIMNGQLEADTVKYLPHVYIALGYDEFQKWLTAYNSGTIYVWPY